MNGQFRIRGFNSGITGVRWHKQSKKWQARIRVDKQLMSLGLYVNLDDAIKAREAANLKYGFHDNHGKEVSNGLR